jgi:hypothetical protein
MVTEFIVPVDEPLILRNLRESAKNVYFPGANGKWFA